MPPRTRGTRKQNFCKFSLRLGKNAGLFVERIAVEAPERTVEEIEAELIARLTRLKIIEAEDAA